MDNLQLYLGVGTIVVAALLMIAKAIVKLTPSKEDDVVVEKVDKAITPILDTLDGDKDSEKK